MTTAKAAATCMIILAAALASSPAWAESPLSAKGSMRDNLNGLHGAKKSVIVVLKSGDKYTAKLGAVGDHHVVLTEPYGKEYYDVLVAIDEIAALEVRARAE